MLEKKKSKALIPFCFGITWVVLQSCQTLYLPNSANVPALINAGQFNGQFSAGSSGAEAQLAYSPVNHLGVLSNISGFKGHQGKYLLVEGGLGYYSNLSSNKMVWDIYGGLGVANRQIVYLGYCDYSKAEGKFYRAFIQPSVRMSSRFLEGIFCVKGAFVFLHDLKSDYSDTTLSANNFFVEPSFTAKIGWEHFKFFAQVGLATPWIPNVFEYNPVHFAAGLNLSLGRKWVRN